LIDVDFFLSVFCYLQMQFMFNFQMFWKFWRNKSVLMYCTFNSGVNSRVGSLVLGDNNTRTSIVHNTRTSIVHNTRIKLYTSIVYHYCQYIIKLYLSIVNY
jgi:hypothetical protein